MANLEFKDRVYKVVATIKKGMVLSYQEVARMAGSPRAYRAVGNILNKNRDNKVPCHRVVKSTGEIGGYAFGATKKVAILKKEGIKIKNLPDGRFFVEGF